MKKSDLVKLVEKLNDDQEVNDLLVGTDIEEEFKFSGLTLDNFKSKIKEDKDFKSYLDSLNDAHHSKAVKTMKEKGTWESEFNDVLKTKYPNLITDPKDKQLLEMEKKIADMEAKEAKQVLLKDAIKYANEKKLPVDFVEKFLGDDLDTTKSNLDGFAEGWSKALEGAVESKMKSSSYTPPGGSGGDKVSIGASFAQQKNSNKANGGKDPWSNE